MKSVNIWTWMRSDEWYRGPSINNECPFIVLILKLLVDCLHVIDFILKYRLFILNTMYNRKILRQYLVQKNF